MTRTIKLKLNMTENNRSMILHITVSIIHPCRTSSNVEITWLTLNWSTVIPSQLIAWHRLVIKWIQAALI